MLFVRLELNNQDSISAQAADLKILFSAVVKILEESKSEKDVLFFLDDVNLLHKESQRVLGQEGHQVGLFF